MPLYHPRITKLTPYIPGDQPQTVCLKLNTNENPYPPSPLAIKAMQNAINGDLRLYPDPNSTKLKQAISDFYQLNITQVFVGNGSDEVLAHAFYAFFKQDKPILFPDISYSFYPVYCRLYDLTFKTVNLDEHFCINPQDYCTPNGGIIFANPNAPTGILLELPKIAQILQANHNSVVIVDEAYIDFGGTSAISLIKDYPNLLIVQTLSKSRSLAGLRVGFALGNHKLISNLEQVKNSFNSYPIGKIAQLGAEAAINDKAYFAQTCAQIINERELLVTNLQKLGFTVLPSSANFVFAKHQQLPAQDLYQNLVKKHIFVRYFNNPPQLANFLRITVGNNEQNLNLITALQEIIAL